MQKLYVTNQGDTWDSIAYSLFGSEKYMQQLMRANWDLLEVMVFPANVEINVPEITIDVENALDQPAWRNVESAGDPLFSAEELGVVANG